MKGSREALGLRKKKIYMNKRQKMYYCLLKQDQVILNQHKTINTVTNELKTSIKKTFNVKLFVA